MYLSKLPCPMFVREVQCVTCKFFGLGIEACCTFQSFRAPCFEFVREVQCVTCKTNLRHQPLIQACYSQIPEDRFDHDACTCCKQRAEKVEQFEQALAQNVSEALQTIRHFTSEHAAIAKQYAVKIKRTRANILLESESGREFVLVVQCLLYSEFVCACGLHLFCLFEPSPPVRKSHINAFQKNIYSVRHIVGPSVMNVENVALLLVCLSVMFKFC